MRAQFVAASLWICAPALVEANAIEICPTMSEKYSWEDYIGGKPLEDNDPATRRGGYLPFWAILGLDDDRGETADDPLGRILASSRYTFLVQPSQYGDKFLVSGGDDYRKCWGSHLSEIPSDKSDQISIFGQRLRFDERGRIFDLNSIYVGDLSCSPPRTSRELYGVHFEDLNRGRYKGCEDRREPTFPLVD